MTNTAPSLRLQKLPEKKITQWGVEEGQHQQHQQGQLREKENKPQSKPTNKTLTGTESTLEINDSRTQTADHPGRERHLVLNLCMR